LIAGAKAKYVVGVRQKTGASFETTAPVGFRQIAVKGTKILLNGEPVFFKGA
jgi:beta-galactosidase/beta-glucuronidase